MIYIPAEGPSNAKLAIVGEAPGAEEERLGRPFVGSTGKINDDILEELNCPRSSVYITNVVKNRPPGNDIDRLGEIGKSIQDYLPQLQAELIALQPNCILALGNTALEALTGYKGIEKYRGSILPCTLIDTKVVPTIHPAALLHSEGEGGMKSWKDLTYIKWDYERAINQSKFKEYNPPRRNLVIAKNALQLDRFVSRYSDSQYVSVDIETYKTFPICVGLAFSKDEAISIPLFNTLSAKNEQGMTKSDQVYCWKLLADILADPKVMKIGQNFKFDERLLYACQNDYLDFGLLVRSFFFDTMLAFRILYPELPSSLQFSTSVLTEEPYYKDEGKEYNPKKDKLDRLLLYNAKDAAITFEVFEKELEELDTRDLSNFFFDRVMPLHPFYSRIEKRGIKRDNFQKLYLEEKYIQRIKEIQKELDVAVIQYLPEEKPRKIKITDHVTITGLINANSNGPKGDVPMLLYGLMKLPVRKDTSEKTLEQLCHNALNSDKHKDKIRVVELILEIRKVRKVIGTYIDTEVDHRGRALTQFRLILETGRTATSVLKPPITNKPMGVAFQTITKHGDIGTDIRSQYVPDEGYVFLEPDLSGAEARVVAILAKDEKLLKIFKYDLDLHRITTAWLDGTAPEEDLNEFFNCCVEDEILRLKNKISLFLRNIIDSEHRQLGKKFRHAGHYDMGKMEASRQTGLSAWRCDKILEKFHANNPNIRKVFHKEIIEALQANNRELTTPHSRTRIFFNRWGPDLFKEAYASIPQSTVSDHTKFAAQRVEKRAPWIQILSESHDSFLSLVPLSYVDKAIDIFKEEMETPIDFSKCSLPRGELIIPIEVFIGERNWEEMKRIL